jgi:hypothetical protein
MGKNMDDLNNPVQIDLRQPYLDLAIESWRFAKLFARVTTKMDLTEANRYSNQLRYFQKRLDDSLLAIEMKIVNLEGQLYDPGMAASPLNIADFGPDDRLMVDQMVEPLIMGPDGIVKSATVMLTLVS